MDINTLLENSTVKDLLKKAGVDEKQAKDVAKQAMSAIQGKFTKDPKKMSSLMSDNPNTPEDESLKGEVEEDFVQNLISKVGLSPEIATQLKGALPGIMNSVTSKLSSGGKNSESGIAGMFGSITDLFDGDMDNDGKKDTGSLFDNLKKKFF